MCKQRRRNNQVSDRVVNPVELSKMSSSSVKEEQLRAWDAAVEAARRRAYQPAPADVLIPWTIANLAATEFCTAAPFPAVNRITLFLRTTLGAMEIARKLNSDFFVGMKMVMVQVTEADLLLHTRVRHGS